MVQFKSINIKNGFQVNETLEKKLLTFTRMMNLIKMTGFVIGENCEMYLENILEIQRGQSHL